jgi:AcrR family transcriptional regulator
MEAILDAAFALIVEKGFASVTLEQIADVACVSKPTVYQYFRSKEDILVYLGIRCLDQVIDHFETLRPEMPARERLDRTLEAFIEFRLDEKIAQFIDLAQHVLPMKHGIDELSEREVALKDAFSQLVREAQKERYVRDDLPPEFLCEVVIGLMKDPSRVWTRENKEDPDKLLRNLRVLLGIP